MTIRRQPRRIAASAALLVAALTVASCSSKSSGGSSGGSAGSDVKTDAGVSAQDITLGVMSDESGPFKNLGLGVVHGNQLWADDVNARGGVCGGRKVKLDVVDSGYKADTAKTLYQQQNTKILGYLQLLGSPTNAALRPNLQSDKVTTLALSWSSAILDNPYEIIPGTTYDVEQVNGLSYLMQQGLISDGDTVGHIYIGGEYGDNGLLGAQYFAKQHHLNLQSVKINSTDTDMTNIVTGFKGAGVKAILLTTAPAQTNSALSVNQALGLNVPVLGNNPTFDPASQLNSPAGQSGALSKLYVVASGVPYSSTVPKAQQIAQKYQGKFPEQPNYGIPYGFAGGVIWEQILNKACQNKDLTREGIQNAFRQSTNITTDNLVAPLDFSQKGAPATRQVYLAQVDAAQPGGLRQVTQLFVSDDAKSYRAPHQQ